MNKERIRKLLIAIATERNRYLKLYEKEKQKNEKWERVIKNKIEEYKDKKSMVNGVMFDNNTKALEEVLQEMHKEEKDLEEK